MAELRDATERASEDELARASELAQLFDRSALTLEEKLHNPGLFMRRQELSYLLANYEIFKLVENVKGSIFYFGVYHGAGLMTFANLAAALEPFNHTRELIGFDTFEGVPSLSDHDTRHGRSFRTLTVGAFSSASEEFLGHMVELYDANRPLGHIPKVRLVAGDVTKTLPEYLERNQHTLASLVVLTMNMYEPTKTAIESLWPRMPAGGVLVVHSLNEDYYPGATSAVLDVLGPDMPIRTFPFAPNLAYIQKR